MVEEYDARKRQELPKVIEQMRVEIRQLQTQLYYSDHEKEQFAPMKLGLYFLFFTNLIYDLELWCLILYSYTPISIYEILVYKLAHENSNQDYVGTEKAKTLSRLPSLS